MLEAALSPETGRACIERKLSSPCFPGLAELAAGRPVDEGEILALLPWLDESRDCADFRAACLLKVLLGYGDRLSPGTRDAIKGSLLRFRYAMEDPGEDSMCFWSENHQILFASAEYLAGGLWPEETFLPRGRRGGDHRRRGRERVLRWLRWRWDFGFSEWHSNTYYEEDAAALALLVDFAEGEVAEKAAMVLDLLLLDLALHSLRGNFAAASGRCYEAQKKDPEKADTREICDFVLGGGDPAKRDYGRLGAIFLLSERYRLPPLIREIAREGAPGLIRSSMGLELREVAKSLPPLRDRSADYAERGLFLWGMEAFTTPESIRLTLEMWRAWRLRGNAFLRGLELLDRPLPSLLLPAALRLLNPPTRGIAIQRGNTYTMRGGDWMLSTAQRHHPGEFGDQQHIWQASFASGATVFVTHPAASPFSDAERNASPGPWVGSGILPDAAQEGRVLLSIYDLRARRGFREPERLAWTHAWLPRSRFEEVLVRGTRAFARSSGAYLALIGRNELREGREGPNELVQEGSLVFWICEIAEAAAWVERGGFRGFIEEVEGRGLSFRGRTLVYEGEKRLSLTWRGAFRVEGRKVEVAYPRLDTPWGGAPRLPKRIELRSAEHGLLLDYEARRRSLW